MKSSLCLYGKMKSSLSPYGKLEASNRRHRVRVRDQNLARTWSTRHKRDEAQLRRRLHPARHQPQFPSAPLALALLTPRADVDRNGNARNQATERPGPTQVVQPRQHLFGHPVIKKNGTGRLGLRIG